MFLGDGIPAVGPCFKDRTRALQVVRDYLTIFSHQSKDRGADSHYSVQYFRQKDGRYTLILKHKAVVAHSLCNVDELMWRRFCQGFKHKFFIITTFYECPAGELECLALSEGLGAVLIGKL
jgi:hypothetical protein